MEENLEVNAEIGLVEVPIKSKGKPIKATVVEQEATETTETMINCLRKERVIVRYIPKESRLVSNPKHVLYGGMAESSIRTFTVPILQSGTYINILTDSEKAFLENIMGLEYNALSIYKKENNYWKNIKVMLRKQDNYFDLSNPDDYIKYKILLANKDFIAASLQVLEERPRSTYQYVIINEESESTANKQVISSTMQCYKEFGKIENNTDMLRVIIEMIEGKPLSSSTKLAFLQTKINNLIQSSGKLFLKIVQDPYLETRVLIKRAIEQGVILTKGDYLYTSENQPLCETGEEPVITIAAKYLNMPKHQEIKFAIEAKLQ